MEGALRRRELYACKVVLQPIVVEPGKFHAMTLFSDDLADKHDGFALLDAIHRHLCRSMRMRR